MMGEETQILVGVETGLLKGLESLRWAIQKLQTHCDILAISTIIQSQGSDSGSSLKVVLKATSSFNGDELIGIIKQTEADFQRQVTSLESLKVFLLAQGQRAILTPQITLPHPILLEQPGWLYCAWEVWKTFRHPILELTIERLLSQHPVTNVEFFGQGKLLRMKL